MPYIDKDSRRIVDDQINILIKTINNNFGEEEIEGVSNYTISKLLSGIFERGQWRYKKINRVMGVLSCISQEFYRRLAGPYEDEAIIKNGDIEYKKACCNKQKNFLDQLECSNNN